MSSFGYPSFPFGAPVPPPFGAPLPPTFGQTGQGQAPGVSLTWVDGMAIDSRSPRALLQNLSMGVSLGSSENYTHQHAVHLLQTRKGRDCALVTSVGVVFKVHGMMLLGGSKVLEEHLYPDGEHCGPAASINLPGNSLPILVDKVVNFIYLGRYDTENEQARLLFNASDFPEKSGPLHFARPDFDGPIFHMHMCALAEELDFLSLYQYAHKRMELLVLRQFLSPIGLAALVDRAFAQADSTVRVCQDKEGWVQKLVVCSALVQEAKYWSDADKGSFEATLEDPAYNVFWDMYEDVGANCFDLLEDIFLAKTNAGRPFAKQINATGNGVQKREASKQYLLQQRTANLARGLEMMGVGGGDKKTEGGGDEEMAGAN